MLWGGQHRLLHTKMHWKREQGKHKRLRLRQCRPLLLRKDVHYVLSPWLSVVSVSILLLQLLMGLPMPIQIQSGPVPAVEAFRNCKYNYKHRYNRDATAPAITHHQSKLLAVPDQSYPHSHSDAHQQSLVTTIAEDVWRAAALHHRTTIQRLLQPGLVGLDHALMKPIRKQFIQQHDNQKDNDAPPLTMLDPKHPIYNFLVEYYGLKGLKGPKRLARWAPSIGLFFWEPQQQDNNNNNNDCNDDDHNIRRIESIQDYNDASLAYLDFDFDCDKDILDNFDRQIFLEGATPDDFALTLYLQGAEWVEPANNSYQYQGKEGILFRPIVHYYNTDDRDDQTKFMAHKKATSFVWYKSILETTLNNEPVLHCYGLHEVSQPRTIFVFDAYRSAVSFFCCSSFPSITTISNVAI